MINMVSKSGGNSIHGSAFEFVRNDAFDARNSFDVCTSARCKPGQVVPDSPLPFRQNQFGGVVSGPIIKNRTFFSASYDGYRYSQPTLALSYAPTAAELAGDFSRTPFGRDIFNPYSTRQVGAAFVRDRFRCDDAGAPLPVNAQNQQDQTIGAPCRKIPQALIFAPMQQFFQTYSATPNLSGDAANNFAQIRPQTNSSNSYQVRVDHSFGESDNVFFRYTEQRVTVSNPIGQAGVTAGSSAGRNYGGGYTHAFGPRLILDVRAGYAGRPGVDSGQSNQHAAGIDPMKQLGFGTIDKFGGQLVRLANWTNGGNNDFGVRGAAPRENPNWSVTPNLIWLKGNHNIKTGFWYIEARRIQLNTFQRYNFSDEQTRGLGAGQNATGLSLASALLGFPSDFQAQLPIEHGGQVKFKYAAMAAYVQDEWKLRPTVTLNLGLRYDYLTSPKTLDGRLWNALDIFNQRYIIGEGDAPLCSLAQQAPCIPDAFRNDPNFNNVTLAGERFFAPPPVKDNFGPRIGVAWAITPKTVLRAGYGLYWDAVRPGASMRRTTWNWRSGPTPRPSPARQTPAPTSRMAWRPTSFNCRICGFATPLPTTNPWNPANTFGDDPNYKDGYSQQYLLEVQRQITPTMLVSAAYVGSKNGRLPYTGFANTARQASRNTCATTDAAQRGVQRFRERAASDALG